MEIALGVIIGVVLTVAVALRIGRSASSDLDGAGARQQVPALPEKSRRAQTQAPARTTSRRTAPSKWVPTPVVGTFVPLSTDGRLSVVGESHYQSALQAVVGGRDAYGFENAVAARAVLVPEPDNPHDRNAVRVDIDGRPVGHIAREQAVAYQPPLLDLKADGLFGTCPAYICCGDEGIYGVWLNLSSPDRLLPVNSADGLHLLSGSWPVTVTREEDHQDSLQQVAKLGRGSEHLTVFAALDVCSVDKGKHKDLATVEVRIDGARVGELTRLQGERYLPIVQPLLDQGLHPGCEASVIHGSKGWQVELRLPKPG